MASDEIESVSSGHDSGRDSCNEVAVTPKKGHEFDNINVVVRVRPVDTDQNQNLNEKNKETSLFPAAGQIQVLDPQSNEQRLFTFNVVFEPEATQIDIFEYSGIKKLIDMALEGFHSTVFAYGQTGSGKTFTLSGTMNEPARSKEPTVGLIQLSFAYLFEQIKIKKQQNISYVITASYLEVYNEQVLDLLNPSGKSLNVRWNKIRGFYAENLFKVECEDTGDLQGVLEEGMKNRQFRSHEMNEHSSRSHTLLTIAIHCITSDPDDSQNSITRQGRLCLVDLAGSEKTKRTKATKATLVEANRINSSLLALGNCISSLASAKKRTGHVPYRDSILTKLLKDSLAGSGLTLMIACVSSHYSDAAETINTLRYAVRATKVKQQPVVRIDPRELLILSLRREIRLLSMENNYLRQKINIPISANLMNELMPKVETQKSANKSEGEKSIETLLKSQSISKQPKEVNEEDLKNPDHMVAKYMQENKDLRTENAQLHLQSQQLREDLEQMSRENERLKKKYDLYSNDKNSPLSKVNSFLNESSKLSNNSTNNNAKADKESHNNDANKNLTFKIRKNSIYNIKQSPQATSETKPVRKASNLPVHSSTIVNNSLSKVLELRGVSAISHSKIRNSKG